MVKSISFQNIHVKSIYVIKNILKSSKSFVVKVHDSKFKYFISHILKITIKVVLKFNKNTGAVVQTQKSGYITRKNKLSTPNDPPAKEPDSIMLFISIIMMLSLFQIRA